MPIMDAEVLARALDDRISDFRKKLTNHYHHRNYVGLRIKGRKGLYTVAVDELERYIDHLVWRYAKWGVTGDHLNNNEQAVNAALKYLLTELCALFNPNRFPSWVLYPYGVNHKPESGKEELLANTMTPAAQPDNLDFEQQERLTKATRWAKQQTIKEMKLKKGSVEVEYLDFAVGLVLSGHDLSKSVSSRLPLNRLQVRALRDRFRKFLRRWYVEKHPKLIYETLRTD